MNNIQDIRNEIIEFINTQNDESIENYFESSVLYCDDDIALSIEAADYILKNSTSDRVKCVINFQMGLYLLSINDDLSKKYFKDSSTYVEKCTIDKVTKAQIYAYADNFDKSIENFKDQDLDLYLNKLYSQVLINNENYEDAIIVYKQILADSRNYIEDYVTYGKLGFANLKLERFREAEECFSLANIVNDDHLLMDVAAYYESIGQIESALKHYQTILESGENAILEKIEYLLEIQSS